ncbi:MAG TPA: hypothetical protein VII73_00390 [Caulobacteraceae bacterium]
MDEAKAAHDWRTFLTDIGVIVIGIAITLTGEQAIEALNWGHKVAASESSMGRELSGDLGWAFEKVSFGACAKSYLDRLQTAVVDNKPAIAQALYGAPPFLVRPWQVTSWDAAVASQVPDHLDRERVADYAIAFRYVATERELQFQLSDDFAEAITKRLQVTSNPQVTNDQLVAIEKLREGDHVSRIIAQQLLDVGKKLGVAPPSGGGGDIRMEMAACEKAVTTAPLN